MNVSKTFMFLFLLNYTLSNHIYILSNHFYILRNHVNSRLKSLSNVTNTEQYFFQKFVLSQKFPLCSAGWSWWDVNRTFSVVVLLVTLPPAASSARSPVLGCSPGAFPAVVLRYLHDIQQCNVTWILVTFVLHREKARSICYGIFGCHRGLYHAT